MTKNAQSGDSARIFKHFTLNCRQKKTLEMPLTQSQQDEMEVIEQWKLSESVDVARIQMQIQFKMLAYLDKQMHEFIALGNEDKLQRQKRQLRSENRVCAYVANQHSGIENGTTARRT